MAMKRSKQKYAIGEHVYVVVDAAWKNGRVSAKPSMNDTRYAIELDSGNIWFTDKGFLRPY